MKNKGNGKSVLLFSGGMDSFILNYLYKPDILLYIKTGCKYEGKELATIGSYINSFGLHEKFKVLDFTFLKEYELENAHIPLRNLIFLEVASFYGDTIYLGALKGETSKDKSKKFRRLSKKILNYCWNDKLGLGTKKKVKIIFPFKKYTKAEVLKKYIENDGDLCDLRRFTVSCYDSEYFMCGKCMSCFRRWVAEELNRVHNSLYHNNPYYYYYDLMSQYEGVWKKFIQIFKPEFWVNLPSNIGAYKAIKKYGKSDYDYIT